MDSRYIVPDGLAPIDLARIHAEFLSIHSAIRVNYRWGEFTEYSVRVRERDAQHIVGGSIPIGVTWRIAFGVELINGELEATFDLQYHDANTREWTSWLHEAGLDLSMDSTRNIVDMTVSFLRERYPVSEALLTIDGRLLARGNAPNTN